MELNSRFNVMTINEVPLYRPEVSSGFSVIFCFCRLRLLRVSLKFSLRSSLLTSCSGLRVDSRTPWSLQTMLLFHVRLEIWSFHHSLALSLPLHWAFEHGFLRGLHFPAAQMSATIIFPRQILPASNAHPRNMPGETFLPYWWSPDRSLEEIGRCSKIETNGMTGPLNGSPKRRSYAVFRPARRSWTLHK